MKTVLIADDEPHVARVLRLVLEKEGYEVCCADNGKQALDLFESREPDVLIADINMPALNGRELVDRVRELPAGGEVPVIVMTSSLESHHQEWLGRMKATWFVGKPVSPRELVAMINGFFDEPQDAPLSAAAG